MTNPRLIDSIVILGKRIQIKERDLSKLEVDGHYLAASALIEIDSSLSPEKQEEILAHEMMHAFLDLSGWSNFLPEAVEESICILTERIVRVFKQPFFKEK